MEDHHSDFTSTEEYRRLMHIKKYTTWSHYIIDRLDFHNFLKVDLKGKHVCFLTLGTINELLLILSRLLLPVVLKELENLFQVY